MSAWPIPPATAERPRDAVLLGEVMALLRADDGLGLAAAQSFRRDVAGAEGNVAVGLARLGHRVLLALRLGDDALGAGVADTFRAEGVDLHVVNDPQRPTGLLIRDVLGDRPITVAYYRAGSAASAMSADDVPLDAIARTRVLHLTGINTVLSDGAAAATAAAVAAAKAAGTTVVFDPNLRRRLAGVVESVTRWMPVVEQSDVVLAGRDEAEAITGCSDPSDAAAGLHRLGPSIVVIKDGAAGAWLSDGTGVRAFSAFEARSVDPVGAGDAFAAGFISALLDDGDVDAAMWRGRAVAAVCVESAGDVTGLPTRAQLDARPFVLASQGAPIREDVDR